MKTINTGRSKCARTGALTPKIILLPNALGPDGIPRAALTMPGMRLPVVYPSVQAAMAVLRRQGGARQ